MGSRGMKREFINGLGMSGLTSQTGEIIRYRAINRWAEMDEFDEWAQHEIALTLEAECIVGVTKEQLAECRPSAVMLNDLFSFLRGAT